VCYIVCVKLTWKLGYFAVDAIFQIRLLKLGFPKEYFIFTEGIIMPVSIFCSQFLALKTPVGKELSLFYQGLY